MTEGMDAPDLSAPAPKQPALNPPPPRGHGLTHTQHDTRPAAQAVASGIAAQVAAVFDNPDAVPAPETPVSPGAPIPLDDNPPITGPDLVAEPAAEPSVEPVPEPAAPAAEPVAEPAEPPAAVEADTALLDALAEVGVELGVDPTSVPPELVPAYNSLVKSAVTLANEVMEATVEAEDLRQQQQALTEKFTNEPDKILVTLALTQPEVFGQVVEVYQRMQEDENYKNIVLREIQSEAKLAEVERRERLMQYREDQRAVRALTAATRRAAAQYGVDATLAEEWIGNAITQNNGRPIPVEQVDGLVKQLQGAGQATVRRAIRPAPAVTPAQAAAAAAAPAALPEGTPAPTEPEGKSYTGLRRGRVSKVRGIIGDAVRKYGLHQ